MQNGLYTLTENHLYFLNDTITASLYRKYNETTWFVDTNGNEIHLTFNWLKKVLKKRTYDKYERCMLIRLRNEYIRYHIK